MKEYGVDDIAKEVGVETATVRVAFRNHNVKKKGTAYTFSKAEKDAVIKKCWPEGKTSASKKAAPKKKAKKAKKKSSSRRQAPKDEGATAAAA